MTYSRLSPETQELLSAYADGELDAAERQNLERRMRANPQLAQALAELQAVKAATASLPRERAPRNFTLTPEQAGIKPKRKARLSWQWVVWGAVGALAVVMIMVMAAGGFVLFGTRTAAAPPKNLAAAPASAPQASPVAEQPQVRPQAAQAKPLAKEPLSAEKTRPTKNTQSPTTPPTQTKRQVLPTPAPRQGIGHTPILLLIVLLALAATVLWLIKHKRR